MQVQKKEIPPVNQAINECSKHIVRGALAALAGGYLWSILDAFSYQSQVDEMRRLFLYTQNPQYNVKTEPVSPFLNKVVLIGTVYSLDRTSHFVFKTLFPDFSKHLNSYAKLIGGLLNDFVCVYAAHSIISFQGAAFNSRDYNLMNAYIIGKSIFKAIEFTFKKSDDVKQADSNQVPYDDKTVSQATSYSKEDLIQEEQEVSSEDEESEVGSGESANRSSKSVTLSANPKDEEDLEFTDFVEVESNDANEDKN